LATTTQIVAKFICKKKFRVSDTAYDFADRRVRLMGEGLSLIFRCRIAIE
jgi:hypothetical protein